VRYLSLLMLLLPALAFAAACGGSGGLPSKDGRYAVQPNSITWDGDQYRFAWADQSGILHQAQTKAIKLLQDDQTYLQVQNHQATLHLEQSTPVTVLAQDSRGNYSNSWFPFLAGAAIGNALSGPRVPTYYYPPTDEFGRGDELVGSVTTTSPKPPNYATIQTPLDAVRPAAGAVAGQNAGTGGGHAATNKLGGAGGAAPAVAGQSGGTGAGSAASAKGGFRSGSSSFSSRGSSAGASSGSAGSASGSSQHTSGSGGSRGSSGGKGISGAGAGHPSAPHSAPSHSFSGGHAGGGHR
jgi:hypothetical protein